jgi:hypothetical protein
MMVSFDAAIRAVDADFSDLIELIRRQEGKVQHWTQNNKQIWNLYPHHRWRYDIGGDNIACVFISKCSSRQRVGVA